MVETYGEHCICDPEEECEELIVEDPDVAPNVHVEISKNMLFKKLHFFKLVVKQ